jgi:peptidoglycan L-alanyl-D-glutamate endopeptidase CwlK
MPWHFSARSLARLQGVHPDLVRLAAAALERSPVDFAVTEGVRTLARQQQLLAAGASKTLDSRHLTGHAIDVGAYVGRELRWDWGLYLQIAVAFRDASKDLRVPVRWGGAWAVLTPGRDPARLVEEYVTRKRAANQRPFLDGAHFELPRAQYPG